MLERSGTRPHNVSMANTPKRPRDTNQLARMITQLATGELDDVKTDDGKDPAAVALGRKGGLKGGKARAEKLSKESLSKIAKNAATLRWQKERQQAAKAESSEKAHPRRVVKTPRGS
jgi:hypothetical protein